MKIPTNHIFRSTLVLGATLLAVTSGWQASAQQGQAGGSAAATADSKTTSFLKQAVRDNDAEIAMAEVGARKAQNAELKSLCQMLQQDHTQANQQLKPIAQKYGVSLNQSLPHKEEREMTRLEKLSGTEFDQKLATQLLRDHEKDINKYDKAIQEVTAPDVKQYAQTTLPKLQQHLQHAATVAKTVGVDSSTISSILKRTPRAVGGTADTTEMGHGAAGKDQNRQGSGASQLQPNSSKP